jgi:hypothetical protein
MRRLQMERFRRLLVNFDDDVAGGPGGDDDDDDGEVQVSASDSTPIVGLIFHAGGAEPVCRRVSRQP